MKFIWITAIFLICFFKSYSQTTTNITVSATLSNPTNSAKVREIHLGEPISNTQTTYNSQIISVYDVELCSYITKKNSYTWLVAIPPHQSVNVTMKCRCLNQGLALPSASSLVPTDYVYSQPNSLTTSQEDTWKTIKQNTGIYQLNCFATGNGNDCKAAIEVAINKIFSALNISLKSINLSSVILNSNCEIVGSLECIDVIDTFNYPAKLINIKIEKIASSDIMLKVSGDIFIEPRFHIFFGKIN